MSKKQSAGLLLFRESAGNLEVLLVHPGGPFWAKKDDGVWSIPKGEFEDDEDPFDVARREFQEETGMAPPVGEFIPLQPVRQPGGKTVHAWAVKGDFDPAALKSNTFSMEWPPRSRRQQEFPEVDRAAWLSIPLAKRKILKGQMPILVELLQKLGTSGKTSESGD
jgi:predicted NUDIX family NTP pyrophosphohydrolase